MPHNQCPPSRRGHAWKEVSSVPPSLVPAHPAELRQCARCGCHGKVNKQGIVKEIA
jgi:hypothetical protein